MLAAEEIVYHDEYVHTDEDNSWEEMYALMGVELPEW